MPIGFTEFDYVVGSFAVLLGLLLLMGPPQRVFLWLPLLLTVDFLLPVGSSTTPERVILVYFVPYAALLLMPRQRHVFGRAGTLGVLWILAVMLSLLWTLSMEGFSLRVISRAAYYLGLLGLFAFSANHLREPAAIRSLLFGFMLAGLVHAVQGAYQLLAFEAGLPFRGIVYSNTSAGVAPTVNGILRVNGFADEPKRLGYILFTAALAGFCLAHFERRRPRYWWLVSSSLLALLVSVFTFSASYFLAAAITVAILIALGGLLTARMRIGLAIVGVAAAIAVGLTPALRQALNDVVDSRTSELEASAESSGPIYRVELFANEYLARYPVAILTGVGLGQYNVRFEDEFGLGAGFDRSGGIRPLNSQALELTFDLSGLVTLSLYLSLLVLCIRAATRRNYGEMFMGSIVLFLVVQSATIQVLPYLCLGASALAAGYLAQQRRATRTTTISPGSAPLRWGHPSRNH